MSPSPSQDSEKESNEFDSAYFAIRLSVLVLLLAIVWGAEAFPFIAAQLFEPSDLLMLQRDIERVQFYWNDDSLAIRLLLLMGAIFYIGAGSVVGAFLPGLYGKPLLRNWPLDFVVAPTISALLGAVVWIVAVIAYQVSFALDLGIGVALAGSLLYLAFRILQAILKSR